MPFLADNRSLHLLGCPIRKSEDQSLLAAPSRVSSLGTSFIGTPPLGIPQTPYVSLDPSSHPTRISSFHPDLPWRRENTTSEPARQQERKNPSAFQEPCSPSLPRKEEQASGNPRQQISLKRKSTVRTNGEYGKFVTLFCDFVSLSERSKAHVFVDASFTHAILHTSSSIRL